MPAKTKSSINSVLRYLGVTSPEARDHAREARIELSERPWPVFPDAIDAPASLEEAAPMASREWDTLRVRKRKALRAIAGYAEAIRRNPSLTSFLEAEIANEKRIHDLIAAYLPDDDFHARSRHGLASPC
ncbi:MAG TPA: hypothetical protein VG166_09825 [Caulobacteraceae bacterium]|jgi:hypothetical protein|nr:hypothetical protein [Caulobacteraceae bacterium]